MRENPKPFEIYRHFKGNLYQILTLAADAEDGSIQVVYQALYGEYKVYVRPLAMFMSETDREKYPDAGQENRFERAEPAPATPVETSVIADEQAKEITTEEIRDLESQLGLDPAVVEFLDADSYEERLNILTSVHHRITDEMLNTMAIAADVEIEPGPVEERYGALKNCLLTKDKFERVRLR